MPKLSETVGRLYAQSAEMAREGINRRTMLRVLAALGFMPACSLDPSALSDDEEEVLPPWPEGPWNEPPDEPIDDPEEATSANIDALMEILIPSDRDEDGAMISPGALDVGARDLLSLATFVPAARAVGLLPEAELEGYEDLEVFGGALEAIVSADLDVMAGQQHLLTPFSGLTKAEQERAVSDAMNDDLMRPLLLVVRAACFIAYLGAVDNDLGLQAIGFPAFVDLDDRVANTGYPRRTDGEPLDPDSDDLAALDEAGLLDDYTYNREPEPTVGDALSDVVDAYGDLI